MKNKDNSSQLLEQHLLSQHFQQVQQQLQILDQQILELQNLYEDLLSLKSQEDSNTFTSLGGGIFIESEIKKSDHVLLSVGSNVLVKKTKDEALKLIKNQEQQLIEIKSKMEAEVNRLNLDILSLK